MRQEIDDGSPGMNIALFGGTFDPIHRGHLALAHAARERFRLHAVHFIPSHLPPHKQKRPLTPFVHRYAMVALATAGTTKEEKAFVPSLLEAPPSLLGRAAADDAQANYSIDTVRRVMGGKKPADKLFFLIGIDAFLEIGKWREPEELLDCCEFIVASRPGFSLRDVALALPASLQLADHVTKPFAKEPARGSLMLRGATIHLLESLHHKVSSTEVRAAAAQGKPLGRWLDPSVASYIRKTGLYLDCNKAR